MRILIVNGPNLHLLGTREPAIYGTLSLADLESHWRERGTLLDIAIETFQSNHEGAIIDVIGAAANRFDALILNAGALTHYSYAIRDAVATLGVPSVEVHISNIYERETWRRHSVLSEVCQLTIVGRGTDGYLHALHHLHASITSPQLVAPYGAPDHSPLDLRPPPAPGPHPVALLIHGGFWRAIWKRDLMDPMAIDLIGRGWATANVEYARGAGSYAEAVGDIESALRWIQANAHAHGLDQDRVVAIGHSAGGYLALRLAHAGSGISGALPLAAVSDLVAMSRKRPDDDPVAVFLGVTQRDAPRLWDQARLAGEPTVPLHLLHGLQDDTVDPAQSETYVRRVRADASITMVDACGHMDLIDPHATAWRSVTTALEGLSS